MKMSRVGRAVAAVLAVAASAACTTPGPASPAASSSALHLAAPLAAGAYVEVRTTAGYRHLYALAPDRSTWRYVGDEPRPVIGQDAHVVPTAADPSGVRVVNMA